MANDVEPMDIDIESEFDNKENTCHGNLLLLDRQHSSHKFTGTASTAPMSKSFTGHSFTPDQNEHLTRSLGPLPANNDVPKLVKLPLTEISSEASSSKEEPRSLQPESPNVDVTVTINDDIDENISFPSSSSSSPSTPIATTPTKEILKPTGSPIMRGIKSMFSMFRPSQSPITPIENENEQDKSSANENMNNVSTTNNPEVVNDNLKTMSSTPIGKETFTSKRNSPLRESIIYKEELSNELTWKNDSTIIFSKEKIPIHKLFYNHIAPACSSTTKQNKEKSFNESVEPMDISCIEPIVTEEIAKGNETECNKSLSETKLLDDTVKDDSIFVDCESTFNIDSCDESQLLRTLDEAEYHPTIDQDSKDDGDTKTIIEHVEISQITQTSVECTNNDSTLKETLENRKNIDVTVSKNETLQNIQSTESDKLNLETTKIFDSKNPDVLNDASHQDTLNTTKILDTTTLVTVKPIESEGDTLATPAILNDINANNAHIEISTVSLNTTKTFHSNVPELINYVSPSDSDNIKVDVELHKENIPNTEISISNQINSTSFTSAEVQKVEVNLQKDQQHDTSCTEIRDEATIRNSQCLEYIIENNKSFHEDPSEIPNVDSAILTELVVSNDQYKMHQVTKIDSHIYSKVESLTINNEENVAYQVSSEREVAKNNDQPYENSLVKESGYVEPLNDHEHKTTDELNTLGKDTAVEFNECILNENYVERVQLDVDGIKNITTTDDHAKIDVSPLKMNIESLQNSTIKLNCKIKLSDQLDTSEKLSSPNTIISENKTEFDAIVSSSTSLLNNDEEVGKKFTTMSDIEKHDIKSDNKGSLVNLDQNINFTKEIPTWSRTFDASTVDNTIQLERSTEEDIFKFENCSPVEQVDSVIKSSDLDFDNIEDPFATKQKIRMSPPATPSRKPMDDIQFDDLENPFATRPKIRLSPPPTNTFVSDAHQKNCDIDDSRFSQTSTEVTSTEVVKVNSDLQCNEKFNENNIKICTELFNDNNLGNEKTYVNQPDIVKTSSVTTQHIEEISQSQYDVTETLLSDNDIIPKSNKTFSLHNCSNQSNAREIIHESTSSEIDNEVPKSRMLPTDNDALLKETEVEEFQKKVPDSISERSKSINESIHVVQQQTAIDMDDQLITKYITPCQSISSSVVDEVHSKLNLTSEIATRTDIECVEKCYIKSLEIDSDTIKTTNQSIVSEQAGDVDVKIKCDDENNTDDEDTLEGPFLDIENICPDDKMELNPFTDHNLPLDETEPGEMFIDAQAFEFLMNQNVNNLVDNGKESLFLKFDPLCAPKLNADGVTAALSKITRRVHIATECSAPLNKLNATEDTISDDSVDDLNTTVSHKPTMAVTPAVSNVTAAPKSNTDTHGRFNLHSTHSPAVAVIDQLLSLSTNNSPARREPAMNHVPEQNEAQITLMHLQQVLTEKTQNILQLRRESVQLKERLTTLESQMKSLESQNEEKLKKINDLNEALADKTKVNKSMASVVEEYERTIAVLIGETEQEKKQHSEERTKLVSERDEQTAHLASMEVSFSDLHSKYEKSKQIILSYKASEDIYKKSLAEFEQSVKKMQANYDSLKQHATAKLNQANVELEKINRAHETEVLKLNTVIKRKELHIHSLEESLIQKTKANEELTAICDELITKVG